MFQTLLSYSTTPPPSSTHKKRKLCVFISYGCTLRYCMILCGEEWWLATRWHAWRVGRRVGFSGTRSCTWRVAPAARGISLVGSGVRSGRARLARCVCREPAPPVVRAVSVRLQVPFLRVWPVSANRGAGELRCAVARIGAPFSARSFPGGGAVKASGDSFARGRMCGLC